MQEYKGKLYTTEQMKIIQYGLEIGLNVAKYANPEYNIKQMKEMQLALILGLEIPEYFNPKMSHKLMHTHICNLLEKQTDKNKISVLFIQPNKYPKKIKINNSLDDMQKLVGGNIEIIYPYEDEIALICNDEGKINGETLNRAIYDGNNNLIDIIAGNFFICYAPADSDNLFGLPKNLEKKYFNKFKFPESFISVKNNIIVLPFTPEEKQIKTNKEKDIKKRKHKDFLYVK